MTKELAEYKEKMGDHLGELFYHLNHDLYMICLYYSQYKKLFTSKKRVKVLNDSASEYFHLSQNIFWDRIILDIAKIIDKKETKQKSNVYKNISINSLPDLITDDVLKSDVLVCINELKHHTDSFTYLRNKIIAHSDLDFRKKASPVKRESIESVECIIKILSKIINKISTFYTNTEISYQIYAISDADSLLYVLRDGLKLEEIRDKQLEEGNFESDSWYKSEI